MVSAYICLVSISYKRTLNDDLRVRIYDLGTLTTCLPNLMFQRSDSVINFIVSLKKREGDGHSLNT